MAIKKIFSIILDFSILFHYYASLKQQSDIFTFFHQYFIEIHSWILGYIIKIAIILRYTFYFIL